MSVRIVTECEQQERPGSDYVRVSTCADPFDDTITLATIQRFVEKQRLDQAARGVHVKTLVMKRPMTTDQALGLATCYAARKNIPVVYTD